MDDEELARLQQLIDEHEAATGERSPLRDILEAQKSQRADLTNLVAPMPEVAAAAQAEEPESRLSPPEALPPPPEVEEPESYMSPPREEPGLEVPKVPTTPIQALDSLMEGVPKPITQVGRGVLELPHQLVGGGLATIAKMPWDMAAGLTAAADLLPRPRSDDPNASGASSDPDAVKKAAEWLLQQGTGADEKLRALLDVQEPKTTAGRVGAAVGKSPFFWSGLGPVATLGASAGQAAIHAGLDWLNTPGLNEVKLAAPPPVSPFSFVTSAYAKPGEPELPVPNADETLQQWEARMKQYDLDLAAWQNKGIPLAVKPPTPPTIGMPTGLTPTASRILNTVGGPQEISQQDFEGMGWLGVATLGMALGPQALTSFRNGWTPRMRTVRDAAPGTLAISHPLDIVRIADDVNKGLVNLITRAGVSPATVDLAENILRIQGRAQAHTLGESAVGPEGRFETPTYSFRVTHTLPELSARATPEAIQYLHLRDAWDQHNIIDQRLKRAPNPNPQVGPTEVNGMLWPDVNRAMYALEQSHPEVKAFARDYYAFRDAVRKFENAGEYRTLPSKNTHNNPAIEEHTLQYLMDQRKNEVPFRFERSEGVSINERENPISALEYYAKTAIYNKLNNEVRGVVINGLLQEGRSGVVVEITPQQLRKNPEWAKNTVSFNHGEHVTRHFTVDPFLADIMKLDPTYFSGPLATSFAATRALLEQGATRLGAPAFAPVSFLRSWQIAKFTTESGRRSPGLVRALYAIPQQLIPQLAKSFDHGLHYGSGQWLTRVFPGGHLSALSHRLAREADKSLYFQLKRFGSSKGQFLDTPSTAAIGTLRRFFDDKWATLTPPEKVFWTAWKQTLEAIHQGPAHAYVAKNLKAAPLSKLALESRRLTGDPRAQGQMYFKPGPGELGNPRGKPRLVRYETDSRFGQAAANALIRGYGIPVAWMQESVPWFNATLQGAKRIGEAYMKNPIKFTGRVWMYAMAPAAAQYLYAFNLGKDPDGVSYVDHMLNRRSTYNRQMNWYIPIAGKRAAEGIEIPFFHELAPFKRLMEIGMDHAFRTDRHKMERKLQEEYWNAMWAFMDTAVYPPMPPPFGLAMAAAGLQPPQSVFSGEAYKRKDDPFSQTGGMSSSMETIARTMAAGIGQTLGQMYAAYSQTPDGFNNAIWNAAKAGGRVQVQKTPFLRDTLEMQPTITGNTEISRELFEKQKEIDRLSKFMQKWDVIGKNTGPGEINVDPASKGGGQVTDWLMGKGFVPTSTGLEQPPATNPLYIHFMNQVRARFRKETPLPTDKASSQDPEISVPMQGVNSRGKPATVYDEGGIGFKSMWRRYGDATEKLQRLKDINEGNNITWLQQLEQRHPNAKQELEEAGVDPGNIRQARNYYERKRHEAARVILYTIRAVENDFTQQLQNNPALAQKVKWDGKPITLKDLDPYKRQGTIGGAQKWLEDYFDPSQFIFPDIVQGGPQNASEPTQ